jgi:hypothetical protein
MSALPSTFDATPTIGGPLFIRLLLQPPPKPLLADSKSTGADSDTFHMVLELLKSKCGSPKQGRTRSYHVNGDTRHHIFEATLRNIQNGLPKTGRESRGEIMKRMTLAPDQGTTPCTAEGVSETSVLAMSMAQPRVLSSKRKLSERIKCLFSKLARVLEGDHEFHRYLGM